MSINYPSSLDNFSNPISTDLLDNSNVALDHWTQHSNANDAIEALEAKVGVDGSAVTTSFDYKLSEITSTDKAVGKTATQILTNKTLTSPTITGATMSGSTLTTTSVNGVTLSTSAGTTVFLRGDGTYVAPTAGDASYSVKGSVQGLTDAATSGLTLSSGVISVNSGTSANNIVKLDGSAKLPAVDGSQLTNVILFKSGVTSRAYNASSGSQTIAHGLGRTPKYIRITAMKASNATSGGNTIEVNMMSVGTYNGSSTATVYYRAYGGTTTGNVTASTDTTNIIYIYEDLSGATATQVATGTVDSTNITLSWTKSGTLGNTTDIMIMWEAQG